MKAGVKGKKTQTYFSVCVSHARVCAHVLHIVPCPAAADPSVIGFVTGVCVRVWQRGMDGKKQGVGRGRRVTEGEVKQMGEEGEGS